MAEQNDQCIPLHHFCQRCGESLDRCACPGNPLNEDSKNKRIAELESDVDRLTCEGVELGIQVDRAADRIEALEATIVRVNAATRKLGDACYDCLCYMEIDDALEPEETP